MLEGQQLGPFLVEKELGSGAMGTVYSGVYTKSGQRVAIKIMAPSLASNEQSAARFEREAAILKQLSHPHIVRLFGIGKHKKMRFYAMEYVEGESLDHILARRGKLHWEEVVNLGVQLCAALQHAHDKGVIHRDLKPSNLMILPDGTLKLTDFGIAKDLDVTALTSANCTVGTAAYMSPEQCRGDRSLTYKSDLYSLGVVFFELLTGRKPFQAENVMEMFVCHVEKPVDRPSRLVMDIPVWMDTLVCQLMEKKPDQRPLNAATVSEALQDIREKVEAQQSAGAEAAGKRRIDQRAADVPVDEADREAARLLRGKKKRRPKKKPFYEKGWFIAAGIVGLLLVLVSAIYLIFQPPSADSLYRQAEELMASSSVDSWYQARSGPIAEYLEHYGDTKGEKTEKVRAWAARIDLLESDQKLANYLRKKQKNITLPAQNDAEELAFEITEVEDEGELEEAAEMWRQVREKFGPGSGYSQWGRLAEARLATYQRLETQDQRWEPLLDEIRRYGREPSGLGELEQQAFLAARARRFGDLFLARRLYQELKKASTEKLEEDEGARYWYLLAAKRARDLWDAKDIDREMVLALKLDELAEQFNREDCANIIALYARETRLQPHVQRARELLQKNG